MLALVTHHEASAARQKSKGSLDFWMKVWMKATGRFSSADAGFRGLGIQKSKNPKKITITSMQFPYWQCGLSPPRKNPNRPPFHCLPKSWIFGFLNVDRPETRASTGNSGDGFHPAPLDFWRPALDFCDGKLG